MELTNSGWKSLIERPLLVPSYLAETVEQLSLLADPLAEVVTEFLQVAAKPLLPEIRRVPTSLYEPEAGPAFDCHYIMGDLSMRVMVPAETVDLLCPVLFGGPVKEVALRTAAGQGIATKVAAAVLMESGQSMSEPTLKTPGEDPLSTDPMICIDYRFDLGDRGSMMLTVAYTRLFTDQMSPPPTTVPDWAINSILFEGLAVVAEQNMPVDFVDTWAPGVIVPLRKASTDRVTLFAVGRDSRTAFAMGEMGQDDGTRCLRLTDVGVEAMAAMAPVQATMSAAPAMAGAEDEAPGELPELAMDFAMANPLEDGDGLPDFPEMKNAMGD